MTRSHLLRNRLGIGPALATLGIFGASASIVLGSSHSDAPRIKQDPQANLTDVYAFVGTRYDDPSKTVLNVIANVRPFSEPGDGPHYERFADDARYSLHITNPATGKTLIRYDFAFSAVDAIDKNPNTILSYGLGTEAGPIVTIGDARQNYVQTYAVSKSKLKDNKTEQIATDLLVAPPNVGGNVTPAYNDADGRAISGAQSLAQLDSYTKQAIGEADKGGEVFFAGPRDDSFYSDIPGVFDLLNVRILDNNGSLADGFGQDGMGVDGFKGFNVLTFGVQIPIEDLPSLAYNDAFFGPQTGVGAFASVSRRSITRIKSDGMRSSTGTWVQVNRLGNPLFNEGLVALADKDRFNRTDPTGDKSFETYASNTELGSLINFLYDTTFQTSDRTDLVAIFIPDVLRVATTTGPVPLDGQIGFSRFGFVGGDLTGGVSSGWPNGRRFGDDVVDIALTAIASGPSFASPLTVVGDNVPANDVSFLGVFPYGGTPHSGTNNSKDSPRPGMEGDLNSDGIVDVRDLEVVLQNISSTRGN